MTLSNPDPNIVRDPVKGPWCRSNEMSSLYSFVNPGNAADAWFDTAALSAPSWATPNGGVTGPGASWSSVCRSACESTIRTPA